jgi:hypothetical protein
VQQQLKRCHVEKTKKTKKKKKKRCHIEQSAAQAEEHHRTVVCQFHGWEGSKNISNKSIMKSGETKFCLGEGR